MLYQLILIFIILSSCSEKGGIISNRKPDIIRDYKTSSDFLSDKDIGVEKRSYLKLADDECINNGYGTSIAYDINRYFNDLSFTKKTFKIWCKQKVIL